MVKTPLTHLKPGKKVSNMLPAGAFGLSLLIHAAVLLFVGGAVLIRGVIPKETFMDMGTTVGEVDDVPVIPEEQMEKPDVEQIQDPSQTKSAVQEDTAAAADVIIASSPNGSMILPPLTGATSPLGTSFFKGTGTGTAIGTGGAAGGAGPSGKRLIKLFNQPVESNTLGVLVDISGSAHPQLLPAFQEIDKNYGNAPMVLAFGCGLIKQKVQLKLRDATPLYKNAPRSSPSNMPPFESTLGQIAIAINKSAELAAYLDKLRARSDVWYIEAPPRGSTRYGFEKLIDQKVDTIFWFADFEDTIEKAEADDLIKKLKRDNITVIIYNFTGRPTPSEQATLATETGGKVISK